MDDESQFVLAMTFMESGIKSSNVAGLLCPHTETINSRKALIQHTLFNVAFYFSLLQRLLTLPLNFVEESPYLI